MELWVKDDLVPCGFYLLAPQAPQVGYDRHSILVGIVLSFEVSLAAAVVCKQDNDKQVYYIFLFAYLHLPSNSGWICVLSRQHAD